MRRAAPSDTAPRPLLYFTYGRSWFRDATNYPTVSIFDRDDAAGDCGGGDRGCGGGSGGSGGSGGGGGGGGGESKSESEGDGEDEVEGGGGGGADGISGASGADGSGQQPVQAPSSGSVAEAVLEECD
jgi:hypothetical protein